MADEKIEELLQKMLMQMEGQQQALVGLTDVLDKYLAVPVRVDTNDRPVSLKEGSAVSVNNRPTVTAEQAGAWSVGVNNTPAVTRARQNWEFTVVAFGNASDPAAVKDMSTKLSLLGAEGWELVNLTGYPLFVASLKRQR